MSRIKDFIFGLSKSTKITLISCGCFILLTLVILIFFVLCPITPSEKAIASFGREGLVYQEDDDMIVTTTAVTTVATDTVTTVTTVTSVSVTTPETFTQMTFNTMNGVLPGGYLQTGEFGENNSNNVTTTLPVQTEETTTEPTESETTPPVQDEPATEAPTELPTSAVIISPTEPQTEAPTSAPATEAVTDPPATEPPPPAPTSPPEEANAVQTE